MSYEKRRYLKPSVFWSIRQGFPAWLSPVLITLSLLVPFIIWCGLSYGGFVNPKFLPTPTTTLLTGIDMLQNEELMVDIVASSLRVLAGFTAAAFVGIPVGLAMGTFYSMDGLLGGFFRTVRYAPIAAFVPLIIIWTGLGESPKIIIIFLGIVFYNATMISDAVKFISDETLNVAYTLGATRRDLLLRVILPATLPNILDTLKLNVAGAWNFLIISELIAAQKGLGFKIIYSQRFLQTDKVLFCILVILAIGLATDLFFKMLFWLCLPWAESKTS